MRQLLLLTTLSTMAKRSAQLVAAPRRSARLRGESAPKGPASSKARAAISTAAKASQASKSSQGGKAGGARRDASDVSASGALKLAAGFEFPFGVDEVGRGCLAGPVVTCACYLPPGAQVEGVTDSKKINTEALREEVFERLMGVDGLRYAIAKAEAPVVDELNILQANLQAMRAASEALCDRLAAGGGGGADGAVVLDVSRREDDEDDAEAGADDGARFLALVDGVDDPWRFRPKARLARGLACRTIKGGDASVHAISAASVIAKVTRDRIMNGLALTYPEYDWASNKAYGTHAHRCAIVDHGWVEGVHRATFDPVRSILEGGGKNKRKAPATTKPKKPAAKRKRATK